LLDFPRILTTISLEIIASYGFVVFVVDTVSNLT
jgi:hypothetical protein